MKRPVFEEQPLSPEEFAARCRVPLTEDEKTLIEWFRRRYPTPEARLRSARRLELQWRRSQAGNKSG